MRRRSANARATFDQIGEYYMEFASKADYAGHYDASGIPMLDYRGQIGLQYNPIAIAQYGLGNYNLFVQENSEERRRKFLAAADWLDQRIWSKTRRGLGLEPSLRLGISRHA